MNNDPNPNPQIRTRLHRRNRAGNSRLGPATPCPRRISRTSRHPRNLFASLLSMLAPDTKREGW